MDCPQKITSLVEAFLKLASGLKLLSAVGKQITNPHILGNLIVMKDRQKLVKKKTQNGLWVPRVAKERFALSNSLVHSQVQ